MTMTTFVGLLPLILVLFRVLVALCSAAWRFAGWMFEAPESVGGFAVRVVLLLAMAYGLGEG